MIASRHITKVVILMVTVAVFLCFSAMWSKDSLSVFSNSVEVAVEYETLLFDKGNIIDINIIMEEDEWNKMLQEAVSEIYYSCNVIINGTTFYNVGIRPKGNTSLSSIAMDPENDRYSFKLEFDQYVDGQTCWGLDKLILNNNYADATNMKEAVIYDMYQYLDADASLYNYAKISVNGNYWGVYLALEAIEDSFLLRNYGVENGKLYKPDNMKMDMDADRKRDANMDLPKDFDEGFSKEDFDHMPPDYAVDRKPGDFNPGRGGDMPEKFPMETGGANLNYKDDELNSYSAIWEGEITKTSDADHHRVVEALKNISEGKNLETYLDIDNILKYMAVHSFAVNEDSLSGTMAHNYYLYEYKGKLNILPWDYNLSFGGMTMGNLESASEMINDPIDTPFSGTEFFDSLLNNETYLEKYHNYYRQLTEKYIFGGGFDETYDRICRQIDQLVKTDPNAMYTYEEYKDAVNMLYNTIMLRGESVLGQLDGIIPSTREGQRDHTDTLIDASEIETAVMGGM